MKTQTISIIIPVFNEEANVGLLHKEITKMIKQLPFNFEIIFVDDGSVDNSPRELAKLAKANKNVRLLQLARNFGKEAALAAGLHTAKGDAVVMMDADLQMPPSILNQFITKWEQGADVVIGVFSKRSMSPIRAFGAKCFYGIMQVIGQTKITPNATDYRLLDRKVVEAYNALTEHNRITRGLIDWLGFQREYVPFEQRERQSGTPNYSMRKLISLALNSFTAYSLVPLKLAGYVGLVILMVTAPLGVFMYVERFLLGDPMGLNISGVDLLAVMLLFLVGVMLSCLGLVSLYIAHIHAEVTNRPLYVVRTEDADEAKVVKPQSEQPALFNPASRPVAAVEAAE